ncbi:MAG: 4Fe-4S binding protein [Spirochaetales bacterium]|nr:4Fe-4S binding protein [Spirochaetales bacterium]
MRSKRYAFVNRRICVSCGACTRECPKSVIAIYKGCYAKVDTDNCIGCGKCSKVCPVGCIEIRDREVVNGQE